MDLIKKSQDMEKVIDKVLRIIGLTDYYDFSDFMFNWKRGHVLCFHYSVTILHEAGKDFALFLACFVSRDLYLSTFLVV